MAQMSLLNKLDKHFVAAAATAVVAGGAQGAIIYSGVVNIAIPLNFDGVYLNVVTGATGTSGAGTPGWDINPYGATALTWFTPGTPAASHGLVRGQGSSTTFVDNLAGLSNYVIDGSASQNYGTGTNETTGATAFVFNSSNNIVGFRFFNEATGAVNYGWMRLSLGASFGSTRSIVDYAYEDTGAGIVAGAIPGPGAIALLGLAGLAGRRRRA